MPMCFFYFAGKIGVSVPRNPRREPAPQRQPFDLHAFLLKTKITIVEVAGAIAFAWMVIRALIHELR
jgi:hypothetical protein